MFRVVHPLYPTADIPSRIKNTKCSRRTDSTKMLCPQYSLLTRIAKGHNITPSHTRVDVLRHGNPLARKKNKNVKTPTEECHGVPDPTYGSIAAGWLVWLPHVDMSSASSARRTRFPPTANTPSSCQPIPTTLSRPMVNPRRLQPHVTSSAVLDAVVLHS